MPSLGTIQTFVRVSAKTQAQLAPKLDGGLSIPGVLKRMKDSQFVVAVSNPITDMLSGMEG